MHFGWLVSLNTSIDKFDKAPVMYEWINTKQCIVYINNLTEYEDPRKILRVVWFTCKELYKFVQEIKVDTEELQELKNNKFKLMDKIKNMRKIMREINTTLNTTRNMLQQIDDEFKELLSSETEKIVESNYSIFDNWWYTNIELTNEENKLLSTDLWLKFKQDNKKTMSEFDVTTDKFKQYLKTKIPMTSIILKNKNMNSAFEIKGIKWKYIKTEEEPILELSLVNEMSNNKIKKKIKSPEVYFNEKLDKKIIEYYNTSNEDIITIANKYNVKTFEIVSLLVRYKIISKRSESRGYDKYKDSEDYKSKLNI
jgi:small-conductance mechanosensitive channel